MTSLTLELSSELYERLLIEAERRRESIQTTAQKLLTERLGWYSPAPPGERERAIAVLRAAGMLAELSAQEKQRAARCDITLEEVRAALDSTGGNPLSELIIEMRGPKDWLSTKDDLSSSAQDEGLAADNPNNYP
jgi:hypothetical protein